MSYIFSSNGNKYTFNKLDSMLISMPEKDGLHVLVRESKADGTPQYSWTDAKIILTVNNAFMYEYTPTENTAINTINESFDIPKGSYIISTRLTCYNEDLLTTWTSGKTLDDVIKLNYYIKLFIQSENNSNKTCIFETKVIDTLNCGYVFHDAKLIPDIPGGTIQFTVETNLTSCLFIKDVKSISVVFEQLS